MKKFITLLSISMLLFVCSCDEEGGDDEMSPAAQVLLLQKSMGTATLTAKVTYNGAGGHDATVGKEGTEKVFIYLYTSLGATNTREPAKMYYAITPTAVTPGTEYTLTINNIAAGTYYAVAFYDYRLGDNYDNQKDYYEIYSNTGVPGSATAVTFADYETKEITIDFNNTWVLESQSAWDATP